MTAFLWLLAILVGIAALIFLVGATVAVFRARNVALAALCGAMLAGLLAVFSSRMGGPLAAIVVSLLTGGAGVVVLRQTTRNIHHATQTARLAGTHIALLLGTFVFMVPFAWLISTSLKADDEMAVFPPVWIPTQQRTSATVRNQEGLPARISRTTDPKTGQTVRVLELTDLLSGEVRVVKEDDPGGVQWTVARKDLKKVRQVAPRWENYPEALLYLPKETGYGAIFLRNTLYLTVMSVVGTLISSSLVAFAFARLRWPGRDAWFVVLLATMMVPGAVTMMPQFLIFRGLGWIDTLLPLWVPAFFGSAFNIFLLRQFFMSIPNELEDAAKIDGCGPFGIYWRIMLPLVKPALAAIAIMATLGAWNNFQGPLIYLSSPEKMPLAYALQLYQQQHGGEPGLLMAASTMVVLPIIVLFFFTQRYFIEGVSLTGLGGR
ncbi:MAG: carbohydrate ABC transporter permease [Capsulimonadales bacterium]|nr:carbohydrate ABC transporter permease [Capsulimonadales bacterium]